MQTDLFGNEDKSPVESEAPKRDNSFEWNQFCRLGEMIGDGLHYEPDGKWITKEYRRLSKILMPELRQQDKVKRNLKAVSIDKQMKEMLLTKRCECGGILKQKRFGTKVCYCEKCNARYVASSKKK
jgi:hypothetical protein